MQTRPSPQEPGFRSNEVFEMDSYLIIGTPGSGRRAALCDLIARGLYGDARAAVMLSSTEQESPFDAALGRLAKVERFGGADAAGIARALAEEADVLFFMADSSRDLADEIEAFKGLCDAGILRLVRIFGFVDCRLFSEAFDECAPFFDAVSHFSDCLILSNRSGVPGGEVAKIRRRYAEMCHPHEVQMEMKNGELENPALLMVDETRRISMAFDDYDPVDEIELDEDTLPEEPFTIERKADPYLERLEGGMRAKKIPNGGALAAKRRDAR